MVLTGGQDSDGTTARKGVSAGASEGDLLATRHVRLLLLYKTADTSFSW